MTESTVELEDDILSQGDDSTAGTVDDLQEELMKMRIFSMNECDTVAAETREDAIDFYREEYEPELDLNEIEEEDPATTNMWYGMSAEELVPFLKEHTGPFPVKRDPRGENELAVSIPYSKVLELDKPTKPCIISSTEY